MFQRLLKFARADLARLWGVWTKISIAGAAVSASLILISGYSRSLAPILGWAAFLGVGLLLASAGAALVALTRKGTSRIAPVIVLCLIAGPGFPFLLMGLVEIPMFALLELLSIPRPILAIGFVLLVVAAVALLRPGAWR